MWVPRHHKRTAGSLKAVAVWIGRGEGGERDGMRWEMEAIGGAWTSHEVGFNFPSDEDWRPISAPDRGILSRHHLRSLFRTVATPALVGKGSERTRTGGIYIYIEFNNHYLWEGTAPVSCWLWDHPSVGATRRPSLATRLLGAVSNCNEKYSQPSAWRTQWFDPFIINPYHHSWIYDNKVVPWISVKFRVATRDVCFDLPIDDFRILYVICQTIVWKEIT